MPPIENNLNNLDKPISIPLICNTEKLRELRILTLLNIKGIEIQVLAFIDTGATSSTICSKIIPHHLVSKAEKPKQSTQFDGKTIIVTDVVKNVQIRFSTTCNDWSQHYPLKHLWVTELNLGSITLILGLDFLLNDNGQFSFNKDYLQISKKNYVNTNFIRVCA